jgi:hypothetical protein
LSVEPEVSSVSKLSVKIINKDSLKEVAGGVFEIGIQAGEIDGVFSAKRKVQIIFMAEGKQVNTSDIITLEPKETIKKEYSFDGRDLLQAIVVDAVTKETIDKTAIKQKLIRDTGGLL